MNDDLKNTLLDIAAAGAGITIPRIETLAKRVRRLTGRILIEANDLNEKSCFWLGAQEVDQDDLLVGEPVWDATLRLFGTLGQLERMMRSEWEARHPGTEKNR